MLAARSTTDFLILGAGVAGLRAAIELAQAGQVLVLGKPEIPESSTQMAQQRRAAALSDEEEISFHLQDTLSAGDGLCNLEAAKILVSEAPERIEELIAWGTQFDRQGTKLSFRREGGHSRNRIVDAQGDSTAGEILRGLHAKAKTHPQISIQEFEFSIDLATDAGRVCGVRVIDEHEQLHTIQASAVLLATGGMGQLYVNTTNPTVATGDGVVMACRAGAEITDLEFIQFHPTALYLKSAPRFLLSEALRGEGGHLRNMEMTRFMPKYHPLAELAPRDVVARAIMHEMGRSRAQEPVVYLDLTDIDGGHIQRRFPRIYSTCMQYNIDITTELIPVRPAAHYVMGGVRTDLDGQTTLPGLFAAGEVAGVGVHGANRLASNSLLEGLVFGARAGRKMRDALKRPSAKTSGDSSAVAYSNGPLALPLEASIREIRELMWKHAGIVRDANGLKQAIARLEEVGKTFTYPHTRRQFEARNLQLAGLLVARSALAREESRGAHYRLDCPNRNDAKFQKHSIIAGEKIRFE
jgi:L-aspartate oxidase